MHNASYMQEDLNLRFIYKFSSGKILLLDVLRDGVNLPVVKSSLNIEEMNDEELDEYFNWRMSIVEDIQNEFTLSETLYVALFGLETNYDDKTSK